MTKILFDEFHRKSSDLGSENNALEAWADLCKQIKERFGNLLFNQETITSNNLVDVDLLILAAPISPFSKSEIKVVSDFVKKGGSVLIASDQYAFVRTNNNVNFLLQEFGLEFRELLNSPPKEAFSFLPHYISSEVKSVNIKEPIYIEKLSNSPYSFDVIATLPDSQKNLLVSVETHEQNKLGRLVALGNYSIFNDKMIKTDSNAQLAMNIIQWLVKQNPLDFSNASIAKSVLYRETVQFAIIITNNTAEQNIVCNLESDALASISEPKKMLEIESNTSQTIYWDIVPERLGNQSLKLTIKHKNNILCFNSAQFQCLPNAEFNLLFINPQGKSQEIVEVGSAIKIKAFVDSVETIPVTMELEYPLTHIDVEQESPIQWNLKPLDPGDWLITLHILETNQKITRLVRACLSKKDTTSKIQLEMVVPLSMEINYYVSQIRQEFNSKKIQEIPFNLLIPDDFIDRVYHSPFKENLLGSLEAARNEHKRFSPLVSSLLNFIAPLYSPSHGCCIPYDPELASHLLKEHPFFGEELSYNFQAIEGHKDYGDTTYLRGNIASLILHEQYGHGFFYEYTKLGQQLGILYRHNLIRSIDEINPKYTEYKSAIQVLKHSAIILNEGFATWMELTWINKLQGMLSHVAYRRKDFLFNRDETLSILAESSEYFQKFEPFYSSKYQEGYEYLEEIQDIFGTECGPKCVVQVVIKAGDIDFGITDDAGNLKIDLSPDEMKRRLLDDESPSERLKAIWKLLREHVAEIRAEQQNKQCHRNCLHPECPVNTFIDKYLTT